MISRIEGELINVENGRAELRVQTLVYELLIPACDTPRLSRHVGETLTFHTLHYLEGQGQGTSFLPRLIGFQTPEDRAFFELFTTVRGFGNRKALRALELPLGEVAHAIASKDTAILTSLPEIGKRTAETIIAELAGKVDRFVEVKARPDDAPAVSEAQTELVRDAVAVLVQLGESRPLAQQLIERALAVDPDVASPDQLVAAAFRLKE
ncbi:MAG: hypothetical protein EA377_06605 [Phycisphaerales bacterium]|nr:MAG: hypothetical protein EA377_06605 [Phycisphaerales bacterium]